MLSGVMKKCSQNSYGEQNSESSVGTQYYEWTVIITHMGEYSIPLAAPYAPRMEILLSLEA